MTGAIASVSLDNGKIHHFVCVKKDGSLGHLIAIVDHEGDNNYTWHMGTLTGQAHQQSQISIGSPNPNDASPKLDVIYQHPSGAVVIVSRDAVTGQWGERRCLSYNNRDTG